MPQSTLSRSTIQPTTEQPVSTKLSCRLPLLNVAEQVLWITNGAEALTTEKLIQEFQHVLDEIDLILEKYLVLRPTRQKVLEMRTHILTWDEEEDSRLEIARLAHNLVVFLES